MTFYRPYRIRVPFRTEGPSMTKQSHKAECDIHSIMRQFQRTGVMEHINRHHAQGRYEELPMDQDYQQSLHTILAAQDAFATLPSRVREHFGNDPARFLSAFSDPKQEEYLRDHGLLKPKEPPPAPVAPTPADNK